MNMEQRYFILAYSSAAYTSIILSCGYVRTANLYVNCSNGLAWDRLDVWSTTRAALKSLQFLDGAGRCAVKHSVSVVNPGQDQATC